MFQDEELDPGTIVLDFETTGMASDDGDRVIEVGAVRIREGVIVDRFQSLMNPGVKVSRFIEDFTGISNEMLETAPPVNEVMTEFSRFLGSSPLVAHNAAFDRRFLEAELLRINQYRQLVFGCSMLVARRMYQNAPNHKLETLIRFKNLPLSGSFHRALADAEMTANLWLQMIADLKSSCGLHHVDFPLMLKLAKLPKHKVTGFLESLSQSP